MQRPAPLFPGLPRSNHHLFLLLLPNRFSFSHALTVTHARTHARAHTQTRPPAHPLSLSPDPSSFSLLPSFHPFPFPPSILSLPRSLPLHLSLLPHAAAVGIKCNGALPSMHIRVSHRRRRNAPPSCAAATRRSPQHSLQPPRSPAAAAATTFSPARPLSARRRAGALCVQGCVAYAIMPAHTHMHTCGYVMGWWRSCCRARRLRQRQQRGCRLCAGRRRQVRQRQVLQAAAAAQPAAVVADGGDGDAARLRRRRVLLAAQTPL